MKLELFFFAGCPHAGPARELLRRCLADAGLPDVVQEHEGDHPSPTIRVDGTDVMGDPPSTGRSCRLELPTEARIVAALRRAQAPVRR